MHNVVSLVLLGLLLSGCASQPYPPLPSGVSDDSGDTAPGVARSARVPDADLAAQARLGAEPEPRTQGEAQGTEPSASAPVPQEVIPPPPDPAALPGADKRQLDIRLASQRFHYFEDDQLVWAGPISAGTAEHPTPKGKYQVQSKLRKKRSGSYTNFFDQPTPMPYSLQFTGPYFVHEGYVTGRPESHGCVRLRHEDARFVYARMRVGDRIVVAD